MSTFVILAYLIRNVCPKLTNSYMIQLILQLYLKDTNNKSNLAVLKSTVIVSPKMNYVKLLRRDTELEEAAEIKPAMMDREGWRDRARRS